MLGKLVIFVMGRELGDRSVPGAGAGDEQAAVEIHIPDGMGTQPLVGWRAWRIQRDACGAACLVSPVFHTVWHAGWTRADPCEACVKSPIGDCHCGINASSERRRLGGYLMHPVVGQVELAGEVRQFQHGYRGSSARPIELHVARGQDALAAELAAIYDCPVLADRMRPRLAIAALLAPAAISGALAIIAARHVVHSATHTLITGQESHQLRTILVAGAVAFIGALLSYARFDLGAPRRPVAYAMLAIALVHVALICAFTTISFETRQDFRAKLAAATRSGASHNILINERSAMVLLPATHIRPGSCTPIRAGHRMVRVCRTAGRLHVTRLD